MKDKIGEDGARDGRSSLEESVRGVDECAATARDDNRFAEGVRKVVSWGTTCELIVPRRPERVQKPRTGSTMAREVEATADWMSSNAR